MGSYTLKDTVYRAAVRPDGRLLVFTFCKGHENNVHPRTDRWSRSCVGDLDKTLRNIGATCASMEDGLTQTLTDIAPDDWAQAQIDHLAQPTKLVSLPEITPIHDPNFCMWMLASGHFDSERHARKAFDKTLAQWGKQANRTANVLDDADLLLELDEFPGHCHNGWPSNPGQDLTGNHLCLLDSYQVKDARLPTDAPMLKAFGIEGMPNIAIWEKSDGQWAIGGRLSMLNYYWKNVFPAHALGNWRPSYQHLVNQIKNQPGLDPQSIILNKPEDHAPHGDIVQWSRLFGDTSQTGSLSVVAQSLSGHILGEMLLRSCTVAQVRITDAHTDAPDVFSESEQPSQN